jgi:general secretion pathway protein G
MHRHLISLLVLASLAISTPAFCDEPEMEAGALRLLPRLPKEPILVMASRVDNLATRLDEFLALVARFDDTITVESIDAKFGEFDERLGCSIRDELLARIGPEFAFVLDLPPIDHIAGQLSNPGEAAQMAMQRTGLVASVRETSELDGCLRKMFAMAGGGFQEEDGLVQVSLVMPFDVPAEPQEGAPPPPPQVNLFYGFREGVFAVGASPQFVQEVLSPGEEAGHLPAGEDFARVFAHLDRQPQSMSYINVPKIRSMVESSMVVQAAINSNPEARQFIDFLMTPEFMGMGIGSTAVEVDGGTRTTSFGPSALVGGQLQAGILAAIAVPNFLNAVDRGKQTRTLSDVRSIGTAVEAYAIDNNVYPAPGEGWMIVDALEPSLVPTYLSTLTTENAWGHALMYWSDGESYRIASPGKDGEMDQDWSIEFEPMETHDNVSDVVFADGTFVVWPHGTEP